MRKLVLFAVLTALTATTFAAGRRDDRDRRSRGNSGKYDNSRTRGNNQSDRSRSRNTRDDRRYDNSRTRNDRRYDDSRTRRTDDRRYDDSRTRRTTDRRYDDSRTRRTDDRRYDDSRTRRTTDRRYDDSRTRRPDPTRAYRRYRHTPYRDHVRHNRRWYTTRDYHRTIRPIYVYNNRWLRVRVSYSDGYWYGSDYPYFIYNGYRHRYSSYDTCNYELVDSYTDHVEQTFYSYTCSVGYDICADLRDDLNYYQNDYRYFCAERYNW
ncbi:hypothetical protein DAY19_07005 [Halobacteriovorax vibrionivorans]|uniref:Uncharacterized protein n=1 Tax=Halobacteriovorax vibrionivorans TaxID=2152716 RepID=A0ABY0IER2_9BACT|nr:MULTISPECIES: hypothetical protein [Halobacteriovorax]RZF21428.1 hypothetical protein DAY19_07005 [Halobacteriovorax vibrionivorans]TGD48700.1 hypothetical protein EP118_02475 [Halobacteriovorax sp. Y22]